MEETIKIMELLGTIAFAISGSLVAISSKLDMFGVSFLACITAFGGGIFRDILIDTTPYVFKKHIYAIAAILGAITYFILRRYLQNVQLASIVSMVLVFAIRMLATRYRWSLPRVYINNDSK